MAWRTSILTCCALLATGCVHVFFDAGISTWNTRYFQAPPIVVKRGTTYLLRWTYGTDGFRFRPEYKVYKGALWFSLPATSSSGNVAGQTAEMEITGEQAIAALESGGAFWREPDQSGVRLTVAEEFPTPVGTRRDPGS